ncbi:MAG: DUF4912 domain-containing protein [Methylobacter sp.]|nr:DUF4912 domain-containing protein [Methylobacter sp.]MDP2100192.1 DUF4912 domain-containing protein [Methylobacter sp.]MDP2426911.1 DUF4912 domain-containing protein [Methylobacter sp.]MDP3053629.1 DUF4912 domain-containing protein [Methylobacter sp.]MDP3360800.1 DUF4912 domain-containing protein [Methylobacter sp.]
MTFLHSGHTSKINLSAKEMLEISQEISRDFTPCFSSRIPEHVEKIKFSPKELFDISEEIGRDFAPKISGNIPELMLMPVDPGHIYAYWNLEQNRGQASNGSQPLLTLRVYQHAEEKMAVSQAPSWFDVPLDKSKTQQQVSLPDPCNTSAYAAAIGQTGLDDSFIVLARSNIIHAPRGPIKTHQPTENSTYCLNKNASGQSA